MEAITNIFRIFKTTEDDIKQKQYHTINVWRCQGGNQWKVRHYNRQKKKD